MAKTPNMVDRAVRLFTFLAKAQQLKQKAIRDVNDYASQDGRVLWLGSLPERAEVTWRPEPGADEGPVLSVERIALPDAPEVPRSLRMWIAGDAADHTHRPSLLEERGLLRERLDDHPEVQELFDEWIVEWDSWAETMRRDTVLQQIYSDLFKTYVQVTQKSEELELLLGVGLLVWNPSNHPRVRRHLFTVPITPRLDEKSGRLEFFTDEAAVGLSAEFDMLDPHIIPDQRIVRETEQHAREFAQHPLDHESIGELAARVPLRLHHQGRWEDVEMMPEFHDHPVVAFAPALILRRRTQASLVRAFTSIAEQIAERGEVPAGLLPLLDPDRLPPVNENKTIGALLEDGDEIISPLPLNSVQRRILERADRHAQTLVQGPPGTGKTHTAAALLTHLLAQGQRVLVTAHTDRALHEVRAKLPQPIRSLAVSVIGASRDDLADLRTAVDTIAQRSGDHDPDDSNAAIDRELENVAKLRANRLDLQRALIGAREAEVTEHQHRTYAGSLASIALEYQRSAEQFEWLAELVEMTPDSTSPISDDQAIEWLRLIRDRSLVEDAPEAGRRRLPSAELPSAAEFAELVRVEREYATSSEQYGDLAERPAVEPLKRLPQEELQELRGRLSTLEGRIRRLGQGVEPWIGEALVSVLSGHGDVWQRRHDDIAQGIAQVDNYLERIPLGTRIDLPDEADRLVALAETMADYLSAGDTLRTTADGSVKVGLLSPGVVKQCRDLFDLARVDGKPPSTLEAMQKITTYRYAQRILHELASLWPSSMSAPDDDNPREVVEWHRSRVRQLEQVLQLGEQARDETAYLRGVGMEPPNWAQLDSVALAGRTVDAVISGIKLRRSGEPILQLRSRLDRVVSWLDAADGVQRLLDAVDRRDHPLYAAGLERLRRLEEVAVLVDRRDHLTSALQSQAPQLVNQVLAGPEEERWDAQLADLEAAYDWGSVGAWILEQDATDINAIQAQINTLDQRLREASVRVAALRAWNHAVGPDRLTPARRADLRNYSQQVSRLGKGTGKYAMQQRAEIRRAMDRCRPAVPVWIMPIYRIAEQLEMEENAFDVVVVDEASQAGLEATFLQYLAPKIVVIGDNKQVSPAAVGQDQQQLRDLASQYLHDDRYKDTWQDPKRSLFDEAQMRYGGQLTLVEQRRCVPEIIGFSSRIAYEPEGIRLVPVRQFGADRLDPFVARYVPPNFDRSGTGINEEEARALVDDLKACLEDPAFEGKTMAVISLVGPYQAKLIESILLTEVSGEDWAARDLRVGVPPDFQGSERDVVFLSMVSIAKPDSRIASLTQEMHVQRFNVAVSRAKDQVRLFHSITLEELPNKQDMRHQLLDYAYGVVRRGRELAPGESPVVPEHELVEPFDSLFEQRVYNRIVDRGFNVVAQSEQLGYFIDLVVVGSSRKLAVECDGDFWHGPEAYERDLRRQRELERCGWEFFRVRESTFYVDPAAALKPLWQKLEEMGIHPAGDEAEMSAPSIGAPVEPEVPVQESPAAVVDEPDEPDRDDREADSLVSIPIASTSDDAVEEPAAIRNGHAPEQEAPPRRMVEFDADAESDDGVLQPYVEFDGITWPVADASRAEMLQGLLRVVETEGPVCWGRLKTAYVHASGGQRVGRLIAEQLDGVIRSAISQGKLVSSGALPRRDRNGQTLRLPDQPEVLPRELGPRALDEVPVEELRAAMGRVMREHPRNAYDFEFVARRTLNMLGRTSLTNSARAVLNPVFIYCSEYALDEEMRPK